MNISYNGYDTKYLTMEGYNLVVGDLVQIDSNNTLQTASSDSNFIGVVATIRDKVICMQEQGYVEMKYEGETPSGPYCKLVANSRNTVKNDDVKGQKAYKIIKIDEDKKIVGFLL